MPAKPHFFMWSQLGGTLPAPLFLFLAGISLALVTDKLRRKVCREIGSRARPFAVERKFSDSACCFGCRNS